MTANNKTILLLPVLLLLLTYSAAAFSKSDNGTEEQPQWITGAVDLPRLQYHIFHSDAVGHTAPLLMQKVGSESIQFYNSLFRR